MKKKRWLPLLCLILALCAAGVSGCGAGKPDQQTTADSGAQAKQKEQKKTQKEAHKEEQPEEDEYYDVDAVEGEAQDYSKYERAEKEQASGAVQGQYGTDPVPEGKQKPVEPEDVSVDTGQKNTCYLSISCSTILDNKGELTAGKEAVVPSDGVIYRKRKVTFYDGESVFDVLRRETKNNRIHMEYSFTPGMNSNYIEGISNLYEFDCGKNSGWMYSVNGWYPNYGASRYAVQQGDVIEWNYTCDNGRDLGTDWMN